MLDYTGLPLPDELRSRIAADKITLDTTFKLEAFNFLIPSELSKKLNYLKIGPLAKEKAVKKFINQLEKEEDDFVNFWSPSFFEKQLLNYYIEVTHTDEMIRIACDRYSNFLSEEKIHQYFNLEKNEKVNIYFAKIVNSPLPEDQISLQFLNVQEDKIKEILKKINTRIDFNCNGLRHQNCIEIYGIMSQIKARIENINLQP